MKESFFSLIFIITLFLLFYKAEEKTYRVCEKPDKQFFIRPDSIRSTKELDEEEI